MLCEGSWASKRPQSQSWDLPVDIFSPILDKLSSIEIRAMRLVCHTWRRDLDANLTHLTLRSLPASQVLENAAANFPRMVSLDCSRAHVCYTHEFEPIAKLTRLKRLAISHPPGVRELFCMSPRLTGLTCLTLELLTCSEEVLASVQSLSSLASLSLTLSLECFWLGLSTLSRLQHLKSLKLRGRSLTCESILALAQMRHLTSLCLAESAPHYLNYVADTAATTLLTSSLAFLPDLQELHVQDCGRPIQNWLAKTLNHRKALTSLAIGYEGILAAGIRNGDLTGLKRLHFPFSSFTDTSCLPQLGKLRGLEYLCLQHAYSSSSYLCTCLTQLKSLRTIIVSSYNKPYRSPPSAIATSLSRLEELHMHYFEGLGLLSRHALYPNLRNLAMTECRSLPADLSQFLQSLSQLSSLDLSNSRCHGTGNLDGVSTLTNLQHLGLGNVGKRGMQASGLQKLTALTYLRHSLQTYTAKDMQSLEGLKQMRRLELVVEGTSQKGLMHLIGGMTALQYLHLFTQRPAKISWDIPSELQYLACQHSLAAIHFCSSSNLVREAIHAWQRKATLRQEGK